MTGRFSLPLYLHFLPKYSIPSNVKPLTLPVARFGSIDHLVCSSTLVSHSMLHAAHHERQESDLEMAGG